MELITGINMKVGGQDMIYNKTYFEVIYSHIDLQQMINNLYNSIYLENYVVKPLANNDWVKLGF